MELVCRYDHERANTLAYTNMLPLVVVIDDYTALFPEMSRSNHIILSVISQVSLFKLPAFASSAFKRTSTGYQYDLAFIGPKGEMTLSGL